MHALLVFPGVIGLVLVCQVSLRYQLIFRDFLNRTSELPVLMQTFVLIPLSRMTLSAISHYHRRQGLGIASIAGDISRRTLFVSV